jgi:hypothetical protein
MQKLLMAAQIDFSQLKDIFHPHGVHMYLEFDGEKVEPAAVSHDNTFADYSTQELGFRITLTPKSHGCIACQHGITIKG